MKHLFLFLLFSVFVTACVSRTPLPVATSLTEGIGETEPVDTVIGIGDIISVGFLSNSSRALDSPYLVAVGDILRVDVFEHPTLSRERVVVLPDGSISLPVVGRVEAAGETVEALGETLVQQYIAGNIINPQVVVSVEQSNDPLEPLLQLVFQGDQYEPLQFVIGHDTYLDLPFIEPVSVESTLTALQSEIKRQYSELFGSRLHVMVQLQKAQPPVVYVIGEVPRPGPVTYTEPYNPLMAVAAAGGLMPSAEGTDIRLFRRQFDNSFKNWSIDLASRLDHGISGGEQVNLIPNDVIYVPRNGIAEANRVVEQYIRNMLPFQVGVGTNYQINDLQ